MMKRCVGGELGKNDQKIITREKCIERQEFEYFSKSTQNLKIFTGSFFKEQALLVKKCLYKNVEILPSF